MLGYLFEKTTQLVSSTIDVVMVTGEFIIDDIKSIPDSIEKGWNEPIFSEDTPVVEDKPKPKFGAGNVTTAS